MYEPLREKSTKLKPLVCQKDGALPMLEKEKKALEEKNLEFKKIIEEKNALIEKLGKEAKEGVKHEDASDKDMSTNLQELKDQLAEARKTEEALNTQIAEKDKELAKSKKAKDTVKELKETAKELRLRVKTLEIYKVKVGKEFRDKEEILNKKIVELENQLKNGTDKKGSIDTKLESEKKTLEEKLVNVEDLLKKSRTNEEELKSKIQDLTKLNDDLMKERSENDSRVSQSEAEKHNDEKRIMDYADESNSNSNTSLSESSEELSEKQAEIVRLLCENERLLKRVCSVELLLEKSKATEKDLQSLLEDIRASYIKLSDDVSKRESTMKQLTVDKEILQKNVKDLESQIRDAKLNEDLFKSKLDEVTKFSSELNNADGEKCELIEKMTSENHTLQKELSDLKAVLEKERANVVVLETKVCDLKAKNEYLSKDAEFDVIESNKDELEHEVLSLKKEVQNAKSSEQRLKTELENVMASIEDLNEMISEKDNIIQDISSSKESNDVMKSELEKLKVSSDELSKELHEKDAIIGKMEIDNKNLERQISDLEEELQHMKASEEDLRVNLLDVKGSSNELNKKLQDKDVMIVTIEKEKRHIEDRLLLLEEELQQVRNGEEELRSNLLDVKGSSDKLLRELSEKDLAIEEIVCSKEELQDQIVQITSSLEKSKCNEDSLKSEVQDLTKSSRKLEEQLTEKEAELVKLSSEISSMQKEFESGRHNEEALKSKLEEMNGALDNATQDLAQKEAMFKGLESDNVELNEKVAKLENQLENATSLEKSLTTQLQESVKAHMDFKETVYGQDERICRILSQKQALEKEVDELKALLKGSESVKENHTKNDISENELKSEVMNNERQKLEAQLTDLKIQLAETVRNNRLLEDKLDEVKGSNKKVKDEVTFKDAQISKMARHMSMLEEEIASLKKKDSCKKLEMEIGEEQGSMSDKAEILSDSEKDKVIDKLKVKSAKLKDKLFETRYELKKARSNVEEIQSRMYDMLDSSNELMQEVSRKDKHIEQLMTEKDSLGTYNIKDSRQVDGGEELKTKLRSTIALTEDLKREGERKDTAIEHLKTEKKGFEKDIAKLELKLKKAKSLHEDEVESARDEYKALKRKFSRLKDQLQESKDEKDKALRERLSGVEEAKKDYHKMLESVKERFEKKNEELNACLKEAKRFENDLKARLESVLDTNKVLSKQLISKQECIENITAKYNESTKQFMDIQSSVQTAKAAERKSKHEFEAIKMNCDELIMKLDVRSKAVQRLVSEKEQILQRLHESQAEYKESTLQNYKLQDKIQAMNEEMRKLGGRVETQKKLNAYLHSSQRYNPCSSMPHRSHIDSMNSHNYHTMGSSYSGCQCHGREVNDGMAFRMERKMDVMEERREFLNKLERKRQDLENEFKNQECFDRFLDDVCKRNSDEGHVV